jgi:phosphoglycolate phosphatase-like HAD superfamily hydrolase
MSYQAEVSVRRRHNGCRRKEQDTTDEVLEDDAITDAGLDQEGTTNTRKEDEELDSSAMAVLAVIFDFDDTLLPDSTSALLEAHGIDSKEFWKVRAKELVDQGYDPPLAYLNLLLQEVGADKPLGELTDEYLRDFGSQLDGTWFPGLPELFDDLLEETQGHRDVSLEFYVISSGLQAIIEGSQHVQKYFRGVYGCQLAEDPGSGVLARVKRCVTFTEKTRFLFEINKGISQAEAATQPHLVNRQVEEEDRLVPLKNMIYVGDGLTDIPCFSVIGNAGGTVFGVFQKGKESAKQAFQQFLQTGRVRSAHHPDFREDAELGGMLRVAVTSACSRLVLKSESAL